MAQGARVISQASVNSQFYIAKIIIKSPINCGCLSKLALVDQRTHLKGF